MKKLAAAAMAAAFALGANAEATIAHDVQISLVDFIFDGISDSQQAYKNLLGTEEL